MSQSPWSTVITSVPTLPRMIRAAADKARPRSEPPYDALLSARGLHGLEVGGGLQGGPHRLPQRRSCRRPTGCAASDGACPRGRCRTGRRRRWSRRRASRPSSAAPGPTARSAAARTTTPTPCSGECRSRVPTSRFSQPTRLLDPGSASSTSSIAEKCERLARGRPVAWTAASLPAFHRGSSGARFGVQAEEAVGRPRGAGPAGSRSSAAPCSTPGSPCGHDQRQAVGAAAQREHHEHRRRRASTRRRPTRWRSPPSKVAPPSASAPRSTLRRVIAANSGQQASSAGCWFKGSRPWASPPEEVGRVEEGGQQPREQPPHHRVVLVDLVVGAGADGLAARPAAAVSVECRWRICCARWSTSRSNRRRGLRQPRRSAAR